MKANQPDALDVGAILAQIREEIRATRQTVDGETAHLALGADVDELRESIAEIEALRAVSAHWPIEGQTPRERGAAFIQRVVRRALQWYITPIVQQQNSYNAAVAHALQLLLESQLELAREIVRLRVASGDAVAPTDGNE